MTEQIQSPYQPQCIKDIQELVLEGFDEWATLGDVRVREFDNNLIFNTNFSLLRRQKWNFFERVSRGLILNKDTGEVVARPFDKLFEWDRMLNNSPKHGFDTVEIIKEKLDGSLGILYRDDGFKIATMGSGAYSPQAIWATQFLNRKYDLTDLSEDLTLMFEIVYPANRIIVDYGETENLFLIGARNRFTGRLIPYNELWRIANIHGFPMPETYTFNTHEEVLYSFEESDRLFEGYVFQWPDGEEAKIRNPLYVDVLRRSREVTLADVYYAFKKEATAGLFTLSKREWLHTILEWLDDIEKNHPIIAGNELLEQDFLSQNHLVTTIRLRPEWKTRILSLVINEGLSVGSIIRSGGIDFEADFI